MKRVMVDVIANRANTLSENTNVDVCSRVFESSGLRFIHHHPGPFDKFRVYSKN